MTLHDMSRGFLMPFVLLVSSHVLADEPAAWPPDLPGNKSGTVTIRSTDFLSVPDAVTSDRGKDGVASFAVAETPPTVDLALHAELGVNAVNRRLWSSWGDICVASDGAVYCAIGDHDKAVDGDARCFIYRWDPARKVLEKIVDMNHVIPPRDGQPAWSKVHAKIDEGPDGNIYFSCTLNDGNRAKLPTYKFNKQLPGGQLYRFDPRTNKTEVFASLPPRRCTATSILDRKRKIWWCNLEAGEGNALWGLDLKTRKPIYQSADGLIAMNRNFALAADGSIYFNGEQSISHFDPTSKKVTNKSANFGDSPGMRCSTRQSKQGFIYGVTHKTNQLFAYHPGRDKLQWLGPNWLAGSYTTVCVLSPDERFVYYLPGSHGKAFRTGTPVIQYDIAKRQQKVLAFLAPPIEKQFRYVPAGTYGVKISDNGDTLYVNFNGHAADGIRPSGMKPIGFGLCAFAAIHIPKSER